MFWRFTKWFALGLGLLLSLLIIAAAIYVRTENFTRWAREQAVAAINEAIRGNIAVERLEGSLWGDLILHNAVLRYEGDEIVAIPRLRVVFSLWPLIWGRVQIARLDAAEPRAILKRNDSGEWNVVEALRSRGTEPEAASAWVATVNALDVHDGKIALGFEGKLYQFTGLNLRGGVRVHPAGLRIDVQEATTLLSAQGQPDLRLKGGLGFQQSAAAPGVFSLKNFWAVSRHSQIRVNGEIVQAEPLRIKAQATLPKLAAADIAYFVPEWPIKHDLAVTLGIDGPLDALNGNIELAAAGAKLTGKFQADVAAELPRYTTSLAVDNFHLRQWLDNQNFSGVVHGTAEISGRGLTLPALAAKAELEVRAAEAHGWSLGNVSMAGRVENSVAALDGRLKSALGGASWSGKVTLQEKPAYELRLAVNDLDIQRTIPDRDTIEGKLNLQGSVKGSGVTLGDINTQAEIQILPSTLGPVAVEQGFVKVSLSDKKLRIAHATLNTAESALTFAGELGLEAQVSGKLNYRLQIAEISPWLSLVDQKGSGSLTLTGQAQGSLAKLSSEGTGRASNVRLDGVAVRDGNVKFTLQGSQEQIFPRGVVTARLSGIDAGMSFRQIDATANLAPQPMPSITLRLNAQDSQARKHALSGVVEFLPDAIVARLREAALASPSGTWTLVHPATVTQRDDSFFIEQLSFRSGESVCLINGRLGLTGAQDLTVSIDQLPLKTLWLFLPEPADMSGVISAQGRITGTAAAPEISALAQLTNASIAGQSYAGARADASYKDKLASFRVSVQQDATHTLTGAGTLPLDLAWQNGARAVMGDNFDFRAQSAGISLGFLNAFGGKQLDRIGGELSLDLTARGSIKQPDVRGTFGLRDGTVRLVPLGVEVTAIAAAGSLDSRNLIIREISAKAKDGEIKGSGSLPLREFGTGALQLSLSAERWPAIETERYQVKVAGNVDIQGSLTAPQIAGQLTVTEGSLRPDLTFLEQSKVPLKGDETIVVIKDNQVVRPPSEQATKPMGPAEGSLFRNLSLDLNLRAPGNLWIRHPDLVSELSGNIRARKPAQREIELTGRVEIVRGWLAFQSRRFQLVRGTIEFTGGDKITPALDILAHHDVQGYRVEAVISGTSEKPTLTLTSEPRLEQADILALLIFGKPLNALNKNEQSSLQQSAVNITGGFVAGAVAKSVSRALGLDALGLDITDVDFGGGSVGVGRYVAPGTYVSYSEQLSGERGREISLEYQIIPNWKISSSTTTTGSNGIDIIWNKRY